MNYLLANHKCTTCHYIILHSNTFSWYQKLRNFTKITIYYYIYETFTTFTWYISVNIQIKVYIWKLIYIVIDGSIFHGVGQYSIMEKWPCVSFLWGSVFHLTPALCGVSLHLSSQGRHHDHDHGSSRQGFAGPSSSRGRATADRPARAVSSGKRSTVDTRPVGARSSRNRSTADTRPTGDSLRNAWPLTPVLLGPVYLRTCLSQTRLLLGLTPTQMRSYHRAQAFGWVWLPLEPVSRMQVQLGLVLQRTSLPRIRLRTLLGLLPLRRKLPRARIQVLLGLSFGSSGYHGCSSGWQVLLREPDVHWSDLQLSWVFPSMQTGATMSQESRPAGPSRRGDQAIGTVGLGLVPPRTRLLQICLSASRWGRTGQGTSWASTWRVYGYRRFKPHGCRVICEPDRG